jgi:hypothetical protein
MTVVMKVPIEQCASAADLFGSKAREDTMPVRVDLMYELVLYGRALSLILGGQRRPADIADGVVAALAQLDEFRHFKEMLGSPLGNTLRGANAVAAVAVEAEDATIQAQEQLIASGHFRASRKGIFLERADSPD